MTMTKSQLERASELVHAREELLEFFSSRDPESDFVKSYLADKYDWNVRHGKAMPTAGVARIELVDAERCVDMDEDDDTVVSWIIPRDILEAALKAYMPSIERELRELGVAVE